jgi:hypothetical protein
MISMDGEYILLARRNIDTSNIFVQYGQGETRTANFSGGPGVQETEFVDGLRFSVQSAQSFRMNVALNFGVAADMVPQGMKSLYAFTWVVNTTMPLNASLTRADVIFPINQGSVQKVVGNAGNARVVPAKRPLGAVQTQAFNVMDGGKFGGPLKVLASSGGAKVKVQDVQSLDGEYVLLVEKAAGEVSSKPVVKGKDLEGKIGKVPGGIETWEECDALLRQDVLYSFVLSIQDLHLVIPHLSLNSDEEPLSLIWVVMFGNQNSLVLAFISCWFIFGLVKAWLPSVVQRFPLLRLVSEILLESCGGLKYNRSSLVILGKGKFLKDCRLVLLGNGH